jgi:hypothetical protein
VKLNDVETPKRQRRPLAFKGSDLRRAINSAREVGLEVSSFEITSAGSIIVRIGKPSNDNNDVLNPWDKAVGYESG